MRNLLINTSETTCSQPILYNAQLHWISYMTPFLQCALGALGFIGLLISSWFSLFAIISYFLIFLFIQGLIKIQRNRSTKIYITENYLSISTGILNKSIIDLKLEKTEGMVLYQSFLGRILEYGTLMVSTGDLQQKYVVEKPMKLREKLLNPKNIVSTF